MVEHRLPLKYWAVLIEEEGVKVTRFIAAEDRAQIRKMIRKPDKVIKIMELEQGQRILVVAE